MARRIDVELTSERGDGTWTWRAAGAREPKGVLDGQLLPAGAAVGDELRVDADFDVDGIVVVEVLPAKSKRRARFETIEILGSGGAEPLVTTHVSGKGAPRDRGDQRRPARARDRRRGERGSGRREAGGRGERKDRGGERKDRRGRPHRSERDDVPPKPKRKRLKAGRAHRRAALAALPQDQQPLAQLVLRGGVPAVRQVVQRQNGEARGQHQPLIHADPLVALAEELLPRLRAAEWKDRAEAALADIDEVDLRDLRSVVTAAETAARDEEGHDLADRLRQGLNTRVEREHNEWLAELSTALNDGRVVRALRLSSRPPKAGAPLPTDLANRLAEQATAGLTAEISQDRFALVLDAVSFSPVHRRVAATSIPTEPSKDLLTAVRKVADRVPGVAAQFGLGPSGPARPTAPRESTPPPTSTPVETTPTPTATPPETPRGAAAAESES